MLDCVALVTNRIQPVLLPYNSLPTGPHSAEIEAAVAQTRGQVLPPEETGAGGGELSRSCVTEI